MATKDPIPGEQLIATERIDQLTKHGFDAAHDDEYNNNPPELIMAAVAVLFLDFHVGASSVGIRTSQEVDQSDAEYAWPDAWDTLRLMKIQAKTRIEQLVIAGALIAAEIDRLQRADK